MINILAVLQIRKNLFCGVCLFIFINIGIILLLFAQGSPDSLGRHCGTGVCQGHRQGDRRLAHAKAGHLFRTQVSGRLAHAEAGHLFWD